MILLTNDVEAKILVNPEYIVSAVRMCNGYDQVWTDLTFTKGGIKVIETPAEIYELVQALKEKLSSKHE